MSSNSDPLGDRKTVLSVDEQRRIELAPEFLQSVLGIELAPRETLRLWARIGKNRNLQLLGPEHELSKLRTIYEAKKREVGLNWDAAEDETAAIIRKLESMLSITCKREPKRRKLRLTFPADAVDLGLLQAPGAVVIFASGQVLEFCQKDRWCESSVIRDLRQYTTQVKSLLDVDEGTST